MLCKTAVVYPLNQWAAGWLHTRLSEIASLEADSLVDYGVCEARHIKSDNLKSNAMKAWLEASYPAGNA